MLYNALSTFLENTMAERLLFNLICRRILLKTHSSTNASTETKKKIILFLENRIRTIVYD